MVIVPRSTHSCSSSISKSVVQSSVQGKTQGGWWWGGVDLSISTSSPQYLRVLRTAEAWLESETTAITVGKPN